MPVNNYNRLSKNVLCLSIILLLYTLSQPLYGEIKALWLTAWDITTPNVIDEAVDFALSNNISQLLVHVRYRSDALYRPNRFINDYPNPEPRSYILRDEKFDPLQYIIYRTAETDIEVHAWVTVFIATPRVIENISADHIFHNNPSWITEDIFHNRMEYDSYEGAYLDPGIPEVHDYLLNVFKDLVTNYPVDGLHLDYIRYPDTQFGYAAAALINYYNSNSENGFSEWKEEQITRFVRRCYAEIKRLNPEIVLSAAVISNLYRAEHNYSQTWTKWLDEGIIDYAYIMAYGLTDEVVNRELLSVKSWNDKIIVGLRAWSEEQRPYNSSDIRSKVSLVKKHDFAGLALFSYNGVKGLFDDPLRRSLSFRSTRAKPADNNFVFGYIKNNGKPLSKVTVRLNNKYETISDSNGFYYFNSPTSEVNSLTAERGIVVFFSDFFSLPSVSTVNSKRYDIRFRGR